VKLPDLDAGNYVVYLKVTGKRCSNDQSYEQVVKRKAADRTENEKLAPFGYAYNLAHSQAWYHMENATKLREKKDQQKASASDGAEEKQEVPSVSGGRPSPIEEEEPLPIRPRPAYDSAGEQFDSPVEDWEALHSSDDVDRKPRITQTNQPAAQDYYDSEEEKMPEP
ncbi:hypothetical protein IL306_011346, partial [Fusarium sp. DS 682]